MRKLSFPTGTVFLQFSSLGIKEDFVSIGFKCKKLNSYLFVWWGYLRLLIACEYVHFLAGDIYLERGGNHNLFGNVYEYNYRGRVCLPVNIPSFFYFRLYH